LYERAALPLQRKHLGRLIGFFVSEIGPLNQVVHLWAFDSLADREQRRKAMEADPLWPSYENALGRAYGALKVQGYTDSTIAFRSPVTFNPDGNSPNAVDGAPSLSNIEYLITTWGTFDTYDLVVYLVGPATAAGFEVNALETLTPANLDAWLDIAQHTIPGIVTVVVDATDSGSFLTALSPPVDTQRIALASTRPGETARFLSGGDLSYDSIDYDSLFAIGFMLFLITLALNLVSQAIVARFREKYE